MGLPRREEPEEEAVRRLEAVDTVRLQALPSRVEAMGDFYGRLLGLRPAEADDAALAFRVGRLEIRVDASAQATPALSPRRLVLEVHRLADVTARLREEKVAYELTHEMGFSRPRVLVTDPAGHRLQLKERWSF